MVQVNDAGFINEKIVARHEVLKIIYSAPNAIQTGVFPGNKGGRCVRLTTLPPSCAVVMKSEKLNFLKPSGPLQACNGTALP
jgi:hypothetical protein